MDWSQKLHIVLYFKVQYCSIIIHSLLGLGYFGARRRSPDVKTLRFEDFLFQTVLCASIILCVLLTGRDATRTVVPDLPAVHWKQLQHFVDIFEK